MKPLINAGKAIQAACYEQRARDISALYLYCLHHLGRDSRRRLEAYWWWGWDINGRSGLGKPGREVGQP